MDPLLKDTYTELPKLPYVSSPNTSVCVSCRLCSACVVTSTYGGAVKAIPLSGIASSCMIDKGYVFPHLLSKTSISFILSALVKLVTTATDNVFTINPARANPRYVIAHPFGSRENKSTQPVLAVKLGSGLKRMIGTMVGYVRDCQIDPAGTLSNKPVKLISIHPVQLEFERAMAFLGVQFGVNKFSIPEFQTALSFKTFAGDDNRKPGTSPLLQSLLFD